MILYIRALLLVSGVFMAGLGLTWAYTWTTLSDGHPRPEFTPTVWILWSLSAVQIVPSLWPRRRRPASPEDAR